MLFLMALTRFYFSDTCLDKLVFTPASEEIPNDGILAIAGCKKSFQKGVSNLNADNAKKEELQFWLDTALVQRFDKRILAVDVHVARKWGEIQAAAESAGFNMPVMDSLIASIGLAFDLIVVTRNTQDMEASRVKLLDPWK